MADGSKRKRPKPSANDQKLQITITVLRRRTTGSFLGRLLRLSGKAGRGSHPGESIYRALRGCLQLSPCRYIGYYGLSDALARPMQASPWATGCAGRHPSPTRR
jgi:hypothetical protein